MNRLAQVNDIWVRCWCSMKLLSAAKCMNNFFCSIFFITFYRILFAKTKNNNLCLIVYLHRCIAKCQYLAKYRWDSSWIWWLIEPIHYLSPVKRICVFEHSVVTSFNCACQPFRGARDLAFCLKVPLDSLVVWASREGSGETARMRRLAWTFAAPISDKYQIRLTRSI